MISLFGTKKEPEEEQPKTGFFDRMKQAVSRTRESLSSKIEGLVALTRTVDESAFEDLESALLSSDLGVQTTTRILDALRDHARRHQEQQGLLVDRQVDWRVHSGSVAAGGSSFRPA